MLAAIWDRPQATFASKVTLNGDAAEVTREIDSGLETIEIDLPAVVTADLRLNEPRYVKLPDIMKAKQKPLKIITIDELNVTQKNTNNTLLTEQPEQRKKGIVVNDVTELVVELKNKGLV